MSPNPIWPYPYKKDTSGHRETEGRRYEDTGKTPYKSRTTWSYQKLGETHGRDSPSEPPEGTNSANTLISNFSLQNCERLSFVSAIQFMVLCYSSPREQIHHLYSLISYITSHSCSITCFAPNFQRWKLPWLLFMLLYSLKLPSISAQILFSHSGPNSRESSISPQSESACPSKYF